MKRLLVIIILFVSLNVFAQQEVEAVKYVLKQQQEAWNHGDISAFMSSYWRSDSLTFIGKSGVVKGWQQTHDNYVKSYPDKATMGQLSFDVLSVEMLSETSAYVIGKWHLKRSSEKGDVGGHFSLLFKRINNRWVIVSDHTS